MPVCPKPCVAPHAKGAVGEQRGHVTGSEAEAPGAFDALDRHRREHASALVIRRQRPQPVAHHRGRVAAPHPHGTVVANGARDAAPGDASDARRDRHHAIEARHLRGPPSGGPCAEAQLAMVVRAPRHDVPVGSQREVVRAVGGDLRDPFEARHANRADRPQGTQTSSARRRRSRRCPAVPRPTRCRRDRAPPRAWARRRSGRSCSDR